MLRHLHEHGSRWFVIAVLQSGQPLEGEHASSLTDAELFDRFLACQTSGLTSPDKYLGINFWHLLVD
jgi:hypothetical protein